MTARRGKGCQHLLGKRDERRTVEAAEEEEERETQRTPHDLVPPLRLIRRHVKVRNDVRHSPLDRLVDFRNSRRQVFDRCSGPRLERDDAGAQGRGDVVQVNDIAMRGGGRYQCGRRRGGGEAGEPVAEGESRRVDTVKLAQTVDEVAVGGGEMRDTDDANGDKNLEEMQ